MKKVKNNNAFLIGNDPDVQAGLQRLGSYDRDINFSTYQQASPYRRGGALYGTDTDLLSDDYIGRPIKEDVPETEESQEQLVDDRGSLLDSWRLFNKRQTESDLTAARSDLQTIAQQKSDLLFARDLMTSMLELKDLSNKYKNTQDGATRKNLADQIKVLSDNVNKGYQEIQSRGRYSDVLRSLFFDTSKDSSEILGDLIVYNTLYDRSSVKAWNAAGNQIKEGWNKSSISDVTGGILKGGLAAVENVFRIAKNAVMSGKRGLDKTLPTWLGGTDKDYNPFVDAAIRESDQSDKRYDKFMITGDEFLDNPSKLNKFNENLSYFNNKLDLEEFDKSKDVAELQDKYINGSWYFNPKAIDPVYEKIQQNANLGIVGSILHPEYSLPELGSSFSDFKHFATLIATDVALSAATSDKAMEFLTKKAVTIAVGGLYGKFIGLLAVGLDAAAAIQNIRMTAAAGETAANIYLTEQMRKNETKLEVFDAYNQRMTQDLIKAGVDINKVIAAGNKKCQELGLPVPTDPAEQFKNALLFDIDIDDPRYKQIADRNKKGLNKIYNENQTLAAKDFIEGFACMPYAGKVMLSAFYRSIGQGTSKLAENTLKYQLGRKTSEKLANAVKNGTASATEKADYYINKFIDSSLNKAFSNPATRVALTRPGKYVKQKAKQIMQVAPLESIEEGQQQLLQQRYSRGEYDNYDKQQSDFDISSLFADQQLGTDALAAYLGSYIGDPTKDELEIRRAMNIGFNTALWFGAPHVLTNVGKTNEQNIRNLIAQTKTDLAIRKYVADTYAKQEDDAKVGMLFDRYQKAGINAQRVIDSMEQMKKYKGGIQGELVTDDYISDDQKLAAQTYNMFKSSILDEFRSDLNIAKGSNEHKMLVQSAVRDIHDYENVLEKYKGNVKKIEEERSKLLSEVAKELSSSVIEDPNDSSKQTVNSSSKYYTLLSKLLPEYEKILNYQNESKKNYANPEKNKQLLKEAEARILSRRRKELELAGVEITNDVWNTEKEQAKNFAQEDVEKYVNDSYTEEERKKGYVGMQGVGTFQDYANSVVNLLIDAQQLSIYRKLINELSTKQEQMKFIHKELGSDINLDSIASFINVLKNQYNALKKSANYTVSKRNALIDQQNAAVTLLNDILRAAGKKRGFQKKKSRYKSLDQILSEYGDFGDISELLRAQGLSAVNYALLQTLKPRVDVFTTGYTNPMLIHSTTRSRKWSELTNTQKEEYRKKVKDEAQKNGQQEPSEKSISSRYNSEQQLKHVELEKIRNQYRKKISDMSSESDMQKTYDQIFNEEGQINEIDSEDLRQLSKEAAKAYVQEVLNERIDNYEERKRIYHLSYQDPVTRIVQDDAAPSEDTTVGPSVDIPADDTETTQSEGFPENPLDQSEMSPEMRRILGLDRQGETLLERDIANILGEQSPVDIKRTDDDTTRQAVADDSDKNLPSIPAEHEDDMPNEEHDSFNEEDPVPEKEEGDDEEKSPSDEDFHSDNEPSDATDELPENDNEDDDFDSASNEGSGESVESFGPTEEETVESLTIEDNQSVESLTPEHDDNSYLSLNPDREYDEGERQDHGRNKPKHPKDVESYNEALADYLPTTFFYSTTPGERENPVVLSVNGQTLKTTYPIRSAKELSEKLTDRNWIYTCDCYYVCSGNTNIRGTKNKDSITVSLIIDDHNTKATYTAFLRTPGKYYWGKSKNIIDGYEHTYDSLRRIGLRDNAIVTTKDGKHHVDKEQYNSAIEGVLLQTYSLNSGHSIPSDEKDLIRFKKNAWEWYSEQDQSTKDDVEDAAYRRLQQPGKRILSAAYIREQIDKLKASRNAIIDAYCDVDNKGSIHLPTTIKTNVQPSKSNISVSNGVFNNEKDQTGRPITKNITDVKQLGLPNDTEQLTSMIEDGSLVFGFGRGKWGNNPYAISSITDPSVDFLAGPNAGKSGAIYMMVDVGKENRVPVQLIPQKFQDQEREDGSWHFINRSSDTLDLCIDPTTGKVNTVFEGDGKNKVAVKPSLAEIILYMVCGKLNVENLPNQDARLNQAILDLIVNTGDHTVLDPDPKIQNDIKQLSTKQIAVVETPTMNGGTKLQLVLGRTKPDGDITQETFDIDAIFDPTDDKLRKDIVYSIKENLHWNTSVLSSGEKDRSISMTDQFPILLQNFLQNYFEQNPNATEYKFCGLNKVSFSRNDLFNEEDGMINPKKCNILSWMITNGHIQTDLGDTVFKDPFLFAHGIEQSPTISQASISKTPGGNSIITANASNQVKLLTRADQESISKLSRQKLFGSNTALNEKNIRNSVAATEEERSELLGKMDGIYDVIALSAELKLGKNAISNYTNSIKQCVKDYIDFVNKEGKLGKKLSIDDVDFSVVNKDSIQNVYTNNYTPVMQITTDGNISILFLDASHIIKQGKRITGVFSKVSAGKALTDKESRLFLSDMLGIDQKNVILLDHLYDIEANEPAFGMVDAITDIFTGAPTGVILLSRENNFGSTFHEAFHYANLILNTRKERLALYKDFVENYRPDLKHATLADIEEQLAIKFQDYMDYKLDNSIGAKIKRFFKMLLDIVNIFKRKSDLVKQTFEMLRHGGYKSKGIDQESLAELKKVYDKNYKNPIHVPGVSRRYTESLPSEISDARTFYAAATAMANRFLHEHIVLKPSDLSAFKGTPYTDFMDKMKLEAKVETDQVKRNIINGIADNPKAFQDIICRMFDEYGVKVRFGKKKVEGKENLVVEDDLTDATGEKTKPENGVAGQNDFVYDIENIALSKKDNAAFRAKLFLGLIEDRRFDFDIETGERKAFPVFDKLLGYPTYKPFSESWNKIVQDCWLCETYDELDPNSKNPNNPYAKTSFRYEVRFRSKSDAFYSALDEKLDKCTFLNDDFEEVPDIELQNLILSTIKSSYPQIGYGKIETSKSTQRRYDNTDEQSIGELINTGNVSKIPSDIEKDFTIFSDNTFKSKRMLPRQWSKNAIVSGLVEYKTSKNGEVNLVIKSDYVQKIITPQFRYIEEQLLTDVGVRSYNPQRRKISNETDAETIYNNVIYRIADLMSEIGIPTDAHTLEYLMQSSNSKAETSYVERCKYLQSIVMKNTGSLGYFIHNVIEPNVGKSEIKHRSVNKNGTNGKAKTTPIEELYYGYNDDAFITKYALAFSAVHPSSLDFSTQSPDNKKLYPVGDNNYITDTIRRADYDIDDFIKNRSRCPYQRHSLFMDVAKNIKRNGFKKQDMLSLMAFVGLKDADQNDGVDYFGMTRLEDFISKMVLMFGDIEKMDDGTVKLINRALILPTMADKKTYYAIRAKLLDDLMCNDLVTNTLSSETGEMLARKFSNATISTFHGYFLDELSTIEQYYSRDNIKWLAEHPGKLKKNYHGKRINIGTKANPIWTLDFSGNGGMFRYCYDFFKDPETGLNLNEMIEAKYQIQKNSDEGDGAFRDEDNEVDGFENVRTYLSEIRQKYGTLNDESAIGINNHLINQVDKLLQQISSSSDMKIVERTDIDGVTQYVPKKIPRAILLYYIDRIQKTRGSKYKAFAYIATDKTLQAEAAYCVMANHYVNNVISMIEYEKNFSGDLAQYKWSYFSKNKKPIMYPVTVEGTLVKIRKLRDKNVDRVKRLGAGLSPGKNIRCKYSQEILAKYPELTSDKFTNAYMKDINSISSYMLDITTRFRGDRIGEFLRASIENNTKLIDNIVKASGVSNIEEFIHGLYYNKEHNGKSYYDIAQSIISKDDVNAIDNEVARQAHPYSGINVSDALVLIRPALYRKIRIGLGEWSFEKDKTGYSDEDAFNIIEKDDSWMTDPEKNKLVSRFQLYPLKMTYFDTNPETESPNHYLGISRYNKQAIFPFFKYIATSSTGSQLYERMNRKNNEIDMLTFDSAVKVGANQNEPSAIVGDKDLSKIDDSLLKNSDQAITDTGIEIPKQSISGIDSVPVQTQYLSRLLKQLNTEAHTDEERAIGTQMFKIAFSDIVESAMYACDNDGNGGRSGKEIRSEIMACIDALTDRGRDYLINKYMDVTQNGIIPNKNAQKQFIQDIIKQNDLGSMALDIVNGKGCVSSLTSRTVFELSTSKKVNSHVVELHTNGGSAIQQSVFGFVGYNNNAVQSYNGSYTMFNEGKKLEWIREDGSMEVLLSMNFFKAVVPNKYQDTYAHMRQWLIDNDVIKGAKTDATLSNPKPFGVGYRIPTQGMSSMFTFTVADVLPEQSGDLIIVPEEFTAQTGSDFDVDKLFLATMKYDKLDEISTIETSDVFDGSIGKTVVGKTSQFRDKSVSEGSILNRLLQDYIDIISDRKNFALSRASIDVFTSIVQDNILPQLRSGYEQYVDGMYELSPMYQSERKMEFTTGKSGIGPFALNITNHALTLFTGLCMDYGSNIYNLGKLNAITGQDGRHILGWLSAMVNAHVDVAKDPYVFTLNVNGITYNMTNFLIRAGKAEATFSFIAQPILKEYANRLNSEGGYYGNNDGTIDNNASLDKRKKRIQASLALKYYNRLLEQYDKNRSKLSKEEVKFWDNEIKNIKVSKTGLIDVSKCTTKADVLDRSKVQLMLNCTKKEHSGYFKSSFYQLLTLKAFLDLSKYADEMSNLVLNSRIDTKKFGNTIADQLNFLNNYNIFKYNTPAKDRVYWYIDKNESEEDHAKTIDEIKKGDNPRAAVQYYFDHTFLDQKLQQATSLTRKILYGQSFAASDTFRDTFINVMSMLYGEEVIEDPNNMSTDPVTGLNVFHTKAYSKVYKKNVITAVATAIENVFRAKCLISSKNYQNEQDDQTGVIDFTFGGDVQEIFKNIYYLLYGNPNAEPSSREAIPLFLRLTNFMKYLQTPTADDAYQNMSEGLVDNEGKITNEFLNFLNPIPPTKKYPQGRLLLKENQYDRSSIRKDILVSSYNDLLTHPNKSVRTLAREVAIYAYYTSYDQNTRDAFFDLVPPYYRQQYDESVSRTIGGEKAMKKALGIISDYSESNKTIDEKYEDIMDIIARNYWYNNDIIPSTVESTTLFKSIDAYQLGNNDHGLVRVRYRNQSKRAINTYGIIVTNTQNGDYFTVTHDNDTYLYKKVGTIDVTKTQNTKSNPEEFKEHSEHHSVYFIIPKLGRHTGRQHQYELINTADDASVYSENDLPTQFAYDNLMLTLLKWINNPSREFKPFTHDGITTQSAQAEFRPLKLTPIRGNYQEFQFSGDNYLNYDGSIRFLMQAKPAEYIMKNSTLVLNFGMKLSDDLNLSNVINISENSTASEISKVIYKFIEDHNIKDESKIKIGLIGDTFNVKISNKERNAFIDAAVNEKSKELYQNESLSKDDILNTLGQYKKYVEDNVDGEIIKRKKTQMFIDVLNDLYTKGYTIQTNYSHGVSITDQAFLNACRIMNPYIEFRLSYAVLPKSWSSVSRSDENGITKFEQVASLYEKPAEYITDPVQELLEDIVESRMKESADKINTKSESNKQEVSDDQSGDKGPEDFNTETQTSSSDMFAALGMDLNAIKGTINKENEKPSDESKGSEVNKNC